ncbi:uncharacterized protein LOC115222236 [Octopus sinensis]|uniref:Uncharacterized protein LOC115222236 n=1 Tax=Octopus sinensis TaxID=2607531 RepID=A0A6P7TB90_9MOLL|nr:uncharacterized protein LOC115222236 [Octopus sinensis]
MAGHACYSFDSVTGTAPDTQTVKWSDMKTGSDPDAYIEGTNLIGEIVINGSKKYYRLDLSRQLEQGHQPSVTVIKHIPFETAEDEEQDILSTLKEDTQKYKNIYTHFLFVPL